MNISHHLVLLLMQNWYHWITFIGSVEWFITNDFGGHEAFLFFSLNFDHTNRENYTNSIHKETNLVIQHNAEPIGPHQD